ncbi:MULTISPECIES: molybdopterin adenylyltransferase [Rhodopseudomonas]|uniref:Molybdopterin adenylyltransferase n=1 Tax=Rhodopseudomonas palustris TaxID=1076 RepID=A0A0D7EXD8_RHOPL|nr:MULTISPECIES: molybdopterin adenylyltransferase [Rhodopseudomonas]KIZ45524.1 molybdopterin adenylyltransferase [Rhodopseudomonas palustris]MDF3809520.1 molybdopterin adenylyltransferase [Rhodopseudomonas sp. BAL398]WOK20653.1 molybdopterin adenylyltransferase [Rhodopseudomonas sp. BAL398]
MRIGILTVSDRASRGEYEDLGGPAIADWLGRAIVTPWEPVRRVIPDGVDSVRDALIQMCDVDKVDLLLTTGGTGPSPRDCTPEATESVIERVMPGFGEAMRLASLEHVPTAILSRQMAGLRGKCLIVNLPGKPASIAVCLQAVFAAVPFCLDLIGAGRIETDATVIAAFRPK